MTGNAKRARGGRRSAVIVLASLSFVLFAAAALFGAGWAFGWFKRTVDSPIGGVESGTFTVKTVAWFDDGSGVVSPMDVRDLIEVDIRNESAANYVGKLRVKSVVTSDIDFALRLSVVNLWFQDDSVPRLNPMPFTVAADVVDNSRRDTSYYFCDTANYTQADYAAADYSDFWISPCKDKEFSFLTGIDKTKLADYESNVTLKLKLQSEIVQANRMAQIWTSVPPPASA